MYILSDFAKSSQEKDELMKLAKRTEQAIIEKCWDQSANTFRCLAKNNSFIATLTVSNLFPLLLPNLPREYAQALLAQLIDPKKFWTPYPIPSVATDEPTFDPDFKEKLIWRGPTWINTNWYIVIGLLRHGYQREAHELAKRTITLVEQEGFREFYQPFTGKGIRVPHFGWSTLASTFDSEFFKPPY
jgi:glycogen debranching enzyme